MAKPPRQGKKNLDQQDNQAKGPAKKPDLTAPFLDTIKESLTSFSKISEDERKLQYGDQEFLDQFREYFKKQNPEGILAGVTKEQLPAYLAELEKRGFPIHTLITRAGSLHAEFASEKPEREVMQETLGAFDTFCKEPNNNIPAGTFKKFADEAGFDHETHVITPRSKLKTIDSLYLFWKSFAEKENIVLKDNQKKNIENILCPNYDPVERVMVEVAITKMRKLLPNAIKDDFDERFALPITAFSSIGNLRIFSQQWLTFLNEHAAQIDKPLAKKLDEVIVTNGDIRTILLASGKKLDNQKGFEDHERYFLRVFNKLATRQLFEEVKNTEAAIDKYVEVVAQSVKGFPPYVNELFKLYPYDDATVAKSDPTLHTQLKQTDTTLKGVEKQITDGEAQQDKKTPKEKEDWEIKKRDLLLERNKLRQQREKIKWDAYVKYLATKDQALSTVMAKLVGAHFDFAQLSPGDQQIILNVLVKNKLNDLIANQAPELLNIPGADLKKFTDDLFDLSKKDLLIPTREGPVHITFKEKKFLSHQASQLLGVNDLGELKSLPLQFTIEPTASSQEFFEQGILRGKDGGMLFETFQSKNGPVVLNDGYKVKLTRDGKSVEGYLSQEPPMDVEEDEKGTGRYLYSHPVTDAAQERKRVTWEDGTRVAIPEAEENNYSLDVLDRSFALNGEAIGSLIFAYVLGQQSMSHNVSREKERELAGNLKKLDKYLDTQNNRVLAGNMETPVPQPSPVTPEKTKESAEYAKFLEERKHLSGYTFPEDTKNFGFAKGTKLYIETGETALPPDTTGGSTRMELEIEEINTTKGTFTVKMHGGEFDLGGHEGATKEMPMNGLTLDRLKDILGKNIYKVPATKGGDPSQVLDSLKKSGFDKLYQENFASTFDTIARDNGKYKFATGDFVDKDVVSFGRDENEYEYDGSRTITKPKNIRYQVKYLPNGKVKISHEFSDDGKPWTRSREMDYANFILFVTSKRLEPQAAAEDKKGKDIKSKPGSPDLEPKQKRQRFSINNIASFFKTTVNKVKDGLKKYDEERGEVLTDEVLQNGAALEKFGKAWGKLFSRTGEAFETAGLEYYTTRDSRIWKKIEKWQKYYEQEAHYASFFYSHLDPMLNKGEVPRDIYKIPAMLLTIINKEKDPYSRNPQLIGKGHRVNLILGKGNQERYLDKLNAKKEELRQNAALNGSNWTVMKNEEIVKFEMKYIISVIDGREHTVSGDYEKAQAARWSRGFANKLDEALGKYGFGETDKKAQEIPMSTTFEFAEFEFSRNVKANKSGSAMPNLKAMAKLAQNESQREVFQMHITSCILSGYFWRTLDAQSKGWIKDMCRTRGFIPGLRAKDIAQQTKVEKLLNIYSKGEFTKSTKFSPDDHTFGKMEKFGGFVHEGFKKRWFKNENGHKFCKFLEMTGDNVDGKKLMDLAKDPSLPNEDKSILQEYMRMGEETSEDIDKDIRKNPSALKGTPFTKCETIVKEMMKYDGPEFAGESSNEKAGPARFWRNVKQGLPTGPNTSRASIEFFMRKFMNRFGHCGFEGGQQPTIFLKRLTTIQDLYKMGRSQEADDMLRYTINGTIISGNSSGKDHPPKEFIDAVDAFKQFFKSNLSTILSPSIVTNTLGEIYGRDKESFTSYEIGNWEEYIRVVKTKGVSMAGLSPEERKRNTEIKQKYQKIEYEIYDQLYRMADSIEDRHSMRNEFKKYYSTKGLSSAQPISTINSAQNVRNPKGIAIANAQSPDEIKANLKNALGNTGSTNQAGSTNYELLDEFERERIEEEEENEG